MPGFFIPSTACGGSPGFSPVPNNVETFRNNRFTFRVYGVDNLFLDDIYQMQRPRGELERITFHHKQGEIYKPGKVKWHPIDFTVYEVFGNSTPISGIFRWFESAKSNSGYKHTATIAMLDGFGSPIWTYKLFECWLSNVSPEGVDQSSSEIARLTVTLSYNNCVPA